jgi:hypothetical protein
MMATNNPMYYFYGLTLGASSKALLSLGPNWRSWEDWLLFAGAFLGALGGSLTNNSNYMLYGLVLGAVGKALPSLAQYHRSLEDWLLLVLPLVTGIASALSSQPKFAMVRLFFGMIGKSLASVDPASTNDGAQPTPEPAPQQPSGLGGNRNYILWNNCIPLVNPSVTFTAGSDMRASGNWDLQVNAYAPSGADAYMQFVLAVTSAGEVQWSIENWPISGDNLFNTCDQPLFRLPSSFLPKGYSIGVKMNTDPEHDQRNFGGVQRERRPRQPGRTQDGPPELDPAALQRRLERRIPFPGDRLRAERRRIQRRRRGGVLLWSHRESGVLGRRDIREQLDSILRRGEGGYGRGFEHAVFHSGPSIASACHDCRLCALICTSLVLERRRARLRAPCQKSLKYRVRTCRIMRFLGKGKALLLMAILLGSFVLAVPLSARAGVSQPPLVQQASGGCNECESHTSTASFGGQVTAGNLIVVGVSTSFEPVDPVSLFTVTDTLGSTYTQALLPECVAPAQESCTAIFYATAASTGADTVTVTVNIGLDPYSLDIFIYDLSGVTTAGATTGTGWGEGELLAPIMLTGAMLDGLPPVAISTTPTSFTNQAFLLGVVNVAEFEDPAFTPGAGFTATPPSSGSGVGFAEYSTNSISLPSGITSPTTFPATLGGGGYWWTEVGLALDYPSQAPVCPSTSGGVIMPIGATYTDQSGNTWTVPGSSYVTYFFAGPQSSVPGPIAAGWGGVYGTYNGQQGWIVNFNCPGTSPPPSTTSTTTTTSTSTSSGPSCGASVFADSITFTTTSATWGSSGNAQGVFVPVTNCWSTTQSLTIYTTLKLGTTTYVLGGGETLTAGQTATVFCQDFSLVVPAGSYVASFSAYTTANQAVSAPTIPVVLNT